MNDSLTDDELLAYLDEQLAVERMTAIEEQARRSEELRQRLAALIQSRDSSELSVGEVWRRNRLSCPTRATLGSYLLNVLDDDQTDYIRFHLETITCRYCAATVEELQQATTPQPTATRRQRIFESSIGHLRQE
mgnify:CR=1 FL=1